MTFSVTLQRCLVRSYWEAKASSLLYHSMNWKSNGNEAWNQICSLMQDSCNNISTTPFKRTLNLQLDKAGASTPWETRAGTFTVKNFVNFKHMDFFVCLFSTEICAVLNTHTDLLPPYSSAKKPKHQHDFIFLCSNSQLSKKSSKTNQEGLFYLL